MIHHLSIPATEPLKVAQILARLLGGDVSRFGPYPGSYIAWARDEAGTAIEVYPVGTEMFPDLGDGQANFRHNSSSFGFTATHAAISLNRTEDEIKAIALAEGWRAIRLPRGGFDVIEFWIENRVMLEILTPEMTADYLRITR